MNPALQQITRHLARLATHYDLTGQWPGDSLDYIGSAGAWTWAIPRQFGGHQLDPLSQVQAYEAIAAGCMSTLLILTQRDAACELIAASENEPLKADLLPRLARHEIMTTVGISQLTTSHQSGRPALAAIPEGDGYRLQGFMPWVTAAGVCQHIVTGAVLPDGRQILAAIPAGLPGLTVDPPMQLMALQPSATCEVHCRNVPVEGRFLIRGPAEQVLSSRSTVKPFVVASAGVGLAAAMVRCMKSASKSAQDPLAELADELAARHEAIRDRLHRHASAGETPSRAAGGDGDSKTQIRIAVNDLLVRLAAAVLTLSKGSGLLRQREPQRLAREALFFLVWSAPEDVRAGTLASLLHRPPPSSASMDWI